MLSEAKRKRIAEAQAILWNELSRDEAGGLENVGAHAMQFDTEAEIENRAQWKWGWRTKGKPLGSDIQDLPSRCEIGTEYKYLGHRFSLKVDAMASPTVYRGEGTGDQNKVGYRDRIPRRISLKDPSTVQYMIGFGITDETFQSPGRIRGLSQAGYSRHLGEVIRFQK
jgi:hypothetical protein